jgi:hypothetical protein
MRNGCFGSNAGLSYYEAMSRTTARRSRNSGLHLIAAILLWPAGCTSGPGAAGVAAGPGADVRMLTGTATRVVWVQHDGKDPEAVGDQLVLMGFNSEDGKGERVILGQRGSYVKPLITPRGDRIVYSTRVKPGPAEVFIVNWDGSGRQKLGDGFALDLWQHPADGGEWAYVGTENKAWEFGTISRFRIDAPDKREVVWNTTLVSIDNFQVSADGRYAGGMFPWPAAAMADLQNRTLKKFGEGCWGALTDARGRLFWYFDGAHRNLTMVDVETEARWIVNINNAPGFDGAEVDFPRWTNHPRFFAIAGPYNQGGQNQARTGGPQTEVYLGRFSDDFSRVEAWARVTTNAGGDSYPDVWIDVGRSPHARQPRGPIGPLHARVRTPSASQAPADRSGGSGAASGADTSRLVVNARLTRTVAIPDPTTILPYRNALIVNEYEIMDLVQGQYAAKQIRIAQWAIRNSRIIPEAKKIPGAAFTLVVERYDAHGELEGERLISTSESSSLPLYYDVAVDKL